MYDFIILGGGMAGASIAYELAVSARICLIEAEERLGVHATGRSAALFSPTYGPRLIRALTRASRAFLDEPPAGFVEAPLLSPRGCLYIANSGQLSRLQTLVQELSFPGAELRALDAEAAIALVPLLRPEYIARAALDSTAKDIDVNALHQGFVRGAKARGARILTGWPASAGVFEKGIWSLAIKDETVCAPIVINAAGAWADLVAQILGARPLGLQPLRRTAIIIDPPDGMNVRDWPFLSDADDQFYVKPDAGRLLLSPADETPAVPGDAHPDEIDIAVTIDRVQMALSLEVRRVRHAWAGLRTFSPDRLPVVGFDPDADGLFWLAGQGGYGIQTAPALARTAAALVQGISVPADIAIGQVDATSLSPARFCEAPVRQGTIHSTKATIALLRNKDAERG